MRVILDPSYRIRKNSSLLLIKIKHRLELDFLKYVASLTCYIEQKVIGNSQAAKDRHAKMYF